MNEKYFIRNRSEDLVVGKIYFGCQFMFRADKARRQQDTQIRSSLERSGGGVVLAMRGDRWFSSLKFKICILQGDFLKS